MREKKGFTLIETTIAVFLFAVVVVGFMQGLNSGILGSYKVRMSNAALDVARSQMEYLQEQEYIIYCFYSTDDYRPCEWNRTEEQWEFLDPQEDGYKKVVSLPDGFSADWINISVSEAPAPGFDGYDMDVFGTGNIVNRSAMQQIDVKVSYDYGGQTVYMTGYKAPRLARVVRGASMWPVSVLLHDMPGLWGISDGGEQGAPDDIDSCCSAGAPCDDECVLGPAPCYPEKRCRSYGSIRGGEGYYLVIRTGTTGPICCSWVYRDHPDGCLDHSDQVGNYANMFLYKGIPSAFGDEGQGQGLVNVMGGEYDPEDICDSDPDCEFLVRVGTHYSSESQRYLASIGDPDDAYLPGVYTILWHNWGYYDIGVDTRSASVLYYW